MKQRTNDFQPVRCVSVVPRCAVGFGAGCLLSGPAREHSCIVCAVPPAQKSLALARPSSHADSHLGAPRDQQQTRVGATPRPGNNAISPTRNKWPQRRLALPSRRGSLAAACLTHCALTSAVGFPVTVTWTVLLLAALVVAGGGVVCSARPRDAQPFLVQTLSDGLLTTSEHLSPFGAEGRAASDPPATAA
eukprot:gene6130-4410_t